MAEMVTSKTLLCSHCGSNAGENPIQFEKQLFCCQGCSSVYQILHKNGLCDFYSLDSNAAVSLKDAQQNNWTLEELDLMVSEFILSETAASKTVLFYIPSIHCSSCIWLLEKLSDLDSGVIQSRTDFLKKHLTVTYEHTKTSFGKIVLLLRSLGYEPSLLPEEENQSDLKKDRKLLMKLGVAGFCTGNIMLFAFPQYFGLNALKDASFFNAFNFFNFALSIPVIFYCASEYFAAFRRWIFYKSISVKVPLALGIGVLWLRSLYEIVTGIGGGYFDSLSGLVFFLLAGTWLQNKVFDSLRFGEKAKKFFPLVARVVVKGNVTPKRVVELTPGDRVRIQFGEVIPADGVLMSNSGLVEYAFATGESAPQDKVAGEIILGGGRNAGGTIELEVIRAFNDSRLSEIWKSSESNNKQEHKTLKFEQTISKYFIATTIIIATLALVVWMPINSAKAWFTMTAVLMVACPCALALAPPFAYNAVSNYFASRGLFVRNPEVVGNLGATEALVFDKTGTLTNADEMLAIIPASYSENERVALKALTGESTHPYSRAIQKALNDSVDSDIQGFVEIPGKGTSGIWHEKNLKLGSFNWICGKKASENLNKKSVWFSINDQILEPIEICDDFRQGLHQSLSDLKKEKIELYLASGDDKLASKKVELLFAGIFAETHYECLPEQKAEIIRRIQNDSHVLMIGDGLNDAGALKAGDLGMVITANTNSFTPEAGAILLQSAFQSLPHFISISKKANAIVKETFIVSLIYNFTAIALAFFGYMEPVIAAIMMPISSIVLMVYAWLRTKTMLKRKGQI